MVTRALALCPCGRTHLAVGALDVSGALGGLGTLTLFGSDPLPANPADCVLSSVFLPCRSQNCSPDSVVDACFLFFVKF